MGKEKYLMNYHNEIHRIEKQIDYDGMKDDFKKAFEEYRRKKSEMQCPTPSDTGINRFRILTENDILELINPVLTLAIRDPQESFYIGMSLYDISTLKEQALKLIIRASEGGISNASYILALFYLYGKEIGMTRCNKKKHVYYLNLAFEQDNDNVYALNLLGANYALGTSGFDKDLKKAFDFCSKASDLGFASAQRNLSQFYMYGDVVDRDVAKALSLLEKAGEGGDFIAIIDLCYYYENIALDEKKAEYWMNVGKSRMKMLAAE